MNLPKIFYARALCVFIICIAGSALIGWQFDFKILTSLGGKTSMNPVTAVSFLMCVVWLLFKHLNSKKQGLQNILNVIPGVLILIGFLKILELGGYITKYFDRWLFSSKLKMEYGYNAIAPNTALLFLLSGILFLNSGNQARNAKKINDILRVIGFLIAYLGIIGYIYRIKPVYQVGFFVPMALNTALCFISIFIISFLSIPPGYFISIFYSDLIGGKLARRALPLILILPAAIGYLQLIGDKYNIFGTREYSSAIFTGIFIVVLFIAVCYYLMQLNKKELESLKANDEILESEKKFHDLVKTMKEGVIYYSLDGKIIFCNNSFCKITGYNKEEITGKNIEDFIAPQGNKIGFKKLLLDKTQGAEFEVEIIHKNGHLINICISSSTIITNEFELQASFSTIVDITERKKNDAKLEAAVKLATESAKKLELSNQELEQFAYVASHDLQEPLRMIKGFMQLLEIKAGDTLAPNLKLYVKHAIDGSERMGVLINNILAYSALTTESVVTRLVDINKIWEYCRKILDEKISETRAVVSVSNLPEVVCNGGQISRVLQNLVENSIKYNHEPMPMIKISCSYENNFYKFSVADNGIGIDTIYREQVFDMFKRLHGKDKYSGTGIGLASVKKIIELHQGKVWIESNYPKGSIFYFTLPA